MTNRCTLQLSHVSFPNLSCISCAGTIVVFADKIVISTGGICVEWDANKRSLVCIEGQTIVLPYIQTTTSHNVIFKVRLSTNDVHHLPKASPAKCSWSGSLCRRIFDSKGLPCIYQFFLPHKQLSKAFHSIKFS